MATSVVMPALEMAQETGKIVSWLKKEGESVAKGEILLEVETDKAVVEIEATADGVLAGIKSHEGDVVPVGRTIAWLVAPGEQPPVEAPAAAPAARMMTAPPPQSSANACRRILQSLVPKSHRRHGVSLKKKVWTSAKSAAPAPTEPSPVKMS